MDKGAEANHESGGQSEVKNRNDSERSTRRNAPCGVIRTIDHIWKEVSNISKKGSEVIVKIRKNQEKSWNHLEHPRNTPMWPLMSGNR